MWPLPWRRSFTLPLSPRPPIAPSPLPPFSPHFPGHVFFFSLLTPIVVFSLSPCLLLPSFFLLSCHFFFSPPSLPPLPTLPRRHFFSSPTPRLWVLFLSPCPPKSCFVFLLHALRLCFFPPCTGPAAAGVPLSASYCSLVLGHLHGMQWAPHPGATVATRSPSELSRQCGHPTHTVPGAPSPASSMRQALAHG